MKKIKRIITLRKLKTEMNRESLKQFEGHEFVVLFDDGKYEKVYFKEELIEVLENDYRRSVWYIFDMTDRIIIDRNVLINVESE